MTYRPSRDQLQRDILSLLRQHKDQPFRPKDIAKQLEIEDRKIYQMFRSLLGEMERSGLVARVKGGKVKHVAQPAVREGVLRVHPNGFGHVEVEGREEDLFVRETNMDTALDSDLVRVGLAAPARGDKKREAEVLEVLERRRTRVVGTFKMLGHFAFVEPDDQRITQDIYVPKEAFNGATDGMKVMVSIDRFDDRKASPEGRILKVIGESDDPKVRVLSLAMSMDVKAEFPEEVEREAEEIAEEIPQKEYERRLDLREEFIFTIDPEDAKDFDDAIHVTRLNDELYEVGVHIADVSHYVRPNTELDKEGFERGTSVYLVDRVIPMLPEKLSNKVCSLRPREDKLTFSCIMKVNTHGELVDYEIRETIIHSKHRLTYEEAQQFIQGGYPDHPAAEHVVTANRLARTLTKKRMREGSVDFDLPEIRVILDEEGHPTDIVRKERIDTNRLIEEFMLLANRAVAHRIAKASNPKPFVYRVHDEPDAERIQQLAEYVRAFGHTLELDGGNVRSTELNALLSKVKGKPEAHVIEHAALRSMSKAIYSTKNIGHYGLGFPHYTHFTSPIRRYPDLMVHRLLKRYATGSNNLNEEKLEARCEHCSERERAAVQAERESTKLKQVEYIRDHLGDNFEGVVTGVTNFGIFIELQEMLVEGLLHVRDLDDDYYELDEENYSLVGRYTGKAYKPGTSVEVTVVGANLEKRQIDFMLA